MAKTRRHLLISACSLLLCILLLAGTTFAWFTDSVTNSGNTIQAGSLSINAFAYDLGEGGITCTVPGVNGDTPFTFEEDGQDLKSDSNPIITETLWEPGSSSAKLLQVTNTGTLATKIRLQFSVSGGLTDALWFDFVQVTSEGSVTGSFTKRPMNTLATFAGNLEIPLSADNGTVYFVLLYGMNQDAGNEYQNASFSADVSILAKQDTVEADGFGDHQYDANATYTVSVSNESEFLAAIENGNSIRLTDSVELSQSVTFDYPAVLCLGNHNITIDRALGNGSIKTTDVLTVEGDGIIEGALIADKGAKLIINAGENFTVESYFVTGAAVSANLNSTLEINGGTYNGNTEGGGGVINALGSYVTIRNATVNVKVDTMIHAVGISAANANETLLENVVVNAGYSVALELNTSMTGHATVIGGTFTTEKVAEGWDPNATIKYGGTLTISGTTINRVGVGILYKKSWPLPTEIVGLNQSDLTFNPIGESAAGYEDTDYYRL